MFPSQTPLPQSLLYLKVQVNNTSKEKMDCINHFQKFINHICRVFHMFIFLVFKMQLTNLSGIHTI